jgi:hypothetical protein
VHFIFEKSVLQLGVAFEVSTQGLTTKFDPEERGGDLRVLWSLVGRVIKAVLWEKTVSIIFTDDSAISIGPTKDRLRGTILGRNDMTIEEF